MAQKLIAISGGIGSGKSTICKILDVLGYQIYDCDSMAKYIMDNSDAIKNAIASEISQKAITLTGEINRKVLAEIVFNDSTKLNILNNIVDSSIKENIITWKTFNANQKLLFIETAILYQSGLDKVVSDVWEVYAPENIRIKRVMNRNHISKEQVIARINSQQFPNIKLHPNTQTIINDDITPIIPQIQRLLLNSNESAS